MEAVSEVMCPQKFNLLNGLLTGGAGYCDIKVTKWTYCRMSFVI